MVQVSTVHTMVVTPKLMESLMIEQLVKWVDSFLLQDMNLALTYHLATSFFVGVGATVVDGTAEITDANTQDHNADADITLQISDAKTYYIQPSMSLYGNSAIYFKLGRTIADLTALGNVTGAPGNLQGETYAIGTSTIANNGLFVKTEAGVTQFENVNIQGIAGSSGSSAEGDPIIAYGSLTLGYKF